ncbi:MAG: glycosyltransferase, partial [Sedimentisphaerales bacterium]|nr:glycosyltransferase [Sedimentisphaerales bacterium]
QNEARICVFSQRHLQQLLSASGDYEFEDLLCEFDDVDILTAQPSHGFKTIGRISNQLARRTSFACLNPGVIKQRIDRDYDLFFAKFLLHRDLLSLNALKNWKERCRTSICWLAEVWVDDVTKWKGYAKILSQFDYVILNCFASVKPMQDLIKRPCLYVPPGIDAIKFCPYPYPPLRPVDVYSIGRKSKVTHRALLKMAEQNMIFYIYDTIIRKETDQPAEHRSLIANIAKRSRYFLVNPAKIDRQFETCGQNEIGFRYFEGAAAGTVMIGEHPETEVFREHFGWTDSVIHMPFDTPDVANILADLDSEPERIAEARKNNIVQSLLRHDWAYRWNTILNLAGLKPNTALTERLEYLTKLAEEIKSDSAISNQYRDSDEEHNTFLKTGT